MNTPRFIRQIALTSGFALCAPVLLAATPGEFDDLRACLERMPVHVTPKQVGAEGSISTTDVALFHFGDEIAGDLTCKTDILFFNGKWRYSVMLIAPQKGSTPKNPGNDLFEKISLYFEHQLGPATHYTITSEIREDGESGNMNRCVFWKSDKTGFEIDLDQQGTNGVALTLCVMSLDYYSSAGFLGERIREFYNDKVFPAAGALPVGFPSDWNSDKMKPDAVSRRETGANPEDSADDPIGQAGRHLRGVDKPHSDAWSWVVGATLFASIGGVVIWLLRRPSKKDT